MANNSRTTRKEQAEITRQKLVDAALILVEKKGYERMTVDDICEKAGVTKGAFYGHFKNKHQVIVEEFLRADTHYKEVFPEIMKEPTYVDKAIAFSRYALQFIADQGITLIKVAYSTTIRPGAKQSPIGSRERALYQIAEYLIREAQAAGEARTDIEAAEMAEVLIRGVRGIVYDWCLHDGNFDLVAAGELNVRVLADGFRPR
jgi:AcrR family transcriptional regulator